MCHRSFPVTAACVVTLFTLLAPIVAVAAEFTWNSGSSGSFSESSKWSPAGGPPQSGDTAIFSDPAPAPYTVTVPAGINTGALQVVGDTVWLDISLSGMILSGDSPSTLLLRANGATPAILEITQNGLMIPLGGIQLSDPTGNPSNPNKLSIHPGTSVSADSLSISSGVVGVHGDLQVARDVSVGGEPGSPAAMAITNNAAIGGAVRVNPDAILSLFTGALQAFAGVHNTGLITGSGSIRADLTNAGELFPELAGGGRHMNLFGRFLQTGEGVLREEVIGGFPVAPLTVTGPSVDVGGTVVLTTFMPQDVRVGERFYLIDTDAPVTFTGTFVSTDAFTFEPLIEPGNGLYAVVTAIPEPAAAALTVAGGFLCIVARRRR